MDGSNSALGNERVNVPSSPGWSEGKKSSRNAAALFDTLRLGAGEVGSPDDGASLPLIATAGSNRWRPVLP